MPTKTVPNLATIEKMLDEVDEWHERIAGIRQKMARVKRGSEAYIDLLSDLWVELCWLESKAQVAAGAIDDYQESLPDDD